MSEKDASLTPAAGEDEAVATESAEVAEGSTHDHDHDEHDHDHDHGHDHDHDHGHGHGHGHHHGHDHDHDQEHEEEIEFVEDPQFELDYKGECRYEVKVVVPAANGKQQTDKLLGELQHEAELPGFRRGRAPRKLLENKFGKAVRDDAAGKLADAAFRKLIKEHELRPLSMPEIDGLEAAKEKGEDSALELTFKFEVMPRCELGDYKGLAVTRPVMKVEQADIDKTIENMRRRLSTYETITDDSAKEGDQIIIDFRGTIEGEEFTGGKAENYPYVLGSKRFFEQFETALTGASTGDSLSTEVPFPEDYSNQSLAGKTAQFEITVHEIKRLKLPDVNEDFAKEIGYDSLEEMHAKVASDLRENVKGRSENLARRNALDQVIENSSYEIPQTLLKQMAEGQYRDAVQRLLQMRVPYSAIQEREAELRADADKEALIEIKRYITISSIAKAEDLEVTDVDFEREAAQIHQETGVELATVNRYLASDDQRDTYENQILTRKALDIVMEHASVTDEEVTEEELEKADAENAPENE